MQEKERGRIEIAILETIAILEEPEEAERDVEQLADAQFMRTTLNSLLRGGFKDPPLDKDVEIHHSAFTYKSEGHSLRLEPSGKEVELTIGEHALLKLFGRGGVVTHADFERVLGKGRETFRVWVRKLRRVLEPDARGGEFRYFVSRGTLGYELLDPDKRKIPDSSAIFDSEMHLELHS